MAKLEERENLLEMAANPQATRRIMAALKEEGMRSLFASENSEERYDSFERDSHDAIESRDSSRKRRSYERDSYESESFKRGRRGEDYQ